LGIYPSHELEFQIIRNMIDEIRLEKLGKVLHLVKKFKAPVKARLT